MNKQLDRKKPYGAIYGVSQYKYEQDGNFYDGAGNMVAGKDYVAPPPPAPKPNAAPEPVRTYRPPPAVDQTIPQFSVADNLPLKVTHTMNIPECQEELDKYGFDWDTVIKQAQAEAGSTRIAILPILKELVKAERSKRGI